MVTSERSEGAAERAEGAEAEDAAKARRRRDARDAAQAAPHAAQLRQQLGDQTASGAPFRYREALRSGNGHVSSKSRLCRDGFGLAWSD